MRTVKQNAEDEHDARIRVHLLHIGKTGGTAVKYALSDVVTARYRIVTHGHDFTLSNVPAGEKVIFFVRDPVSRFISGFYSRQRQGKPRYNVPWSPDEAMAFSFYSTPNELAICLGSTDASRRMKAERAMKSIQHVNASYWDWFGDDERLASRIDDMIFVGAQERLTKDFESLKRMLGVDRGIELPRDSTAAHCNPEELDRSLSNQAVETLARWYESEYDFLETISSKFANIPKYGPRMHRGASPSARNRTSGRF